MCQPTACKCALLMINNVCARTDKRSVQCGSAVSYAKHGGTATGADYVCNNKKTTRLSGLFWRLLRDSDPRVLANLRASTARSSVNGKAEHQRCGCPVLRKQQKNHSLEWLVLAPVEGLGPPTLRLTAACSTDWAKQARLILTVLTDNQKQAIHIECLLIIILL